MKSWPNPCQTDLQHWLSTPRSLHQGWPGECFCLHAIIRPSLAFGCPTWLRLKRLHCHGFFGCSDEAEIDRDRLPLFRLHSTCFGHGHPFAQALDGISFSHADVMTSQLFETLIARSSPRPRKQYPPDCFGNYIGAINFANHCWAVAGLARDRFDSELKPEILSHLDGWFGSVPSEDWVTLSVYMIGRTKRTACPTVLFISANGHYRKEARKVIKESGILKQYPGFKTAHTSTDPGWGGLLEQLALGEETKASRSVQKDSQATEVFYERTKHLQPFGLPIYIRHGSAMRVATANAIRLRGHLFYLAPSHAFFDRLEKSQGPASEPGGVFEIDSDSEAEYEGVVDWTTSMGSESTDTLSDSEDSSDSEIHSTTTLDTPEIPSTMTSPPRFRQLSGKILPYAKTQTGYMPRQITMPPMECLARLGVLFDWSVDQDWALVEVVEDGDPYIASIISANLHDLARVPVAVLPQNGGTVVTYTASGGQMTGSIIGTPSYTRLPRGTSFQEVFSIHLSGPLADGDCGSAVFSAATGSLFGHIVAGCRSTGFAYVMAAHHVIPQLSKSALQIKDEEFHGCSQTELDNDTALKSKGKYPETSLVPATQSQHSSIMWPGPTQRLSFASQAYTQVPGLRRAASFMYGDTPVARQSSRVLEHVPSSLPCEFRDISGCSRIFPMHDKQYWVDHMIDDHLHGCLPRFSICWFCDHKIFQALSNQNDDKRECYLQRMYHIAEHFSDGMRPADIRPDLHFLDHLYRYKLIDEQTFERAKPQAPNFGGEFPRRHLPYSSGYNEIYATTSHCTAPNITDKVYEKSATPSRGKCHQSADLLSANQKNVSRGDANQPDST